jgi:hypothetical protein
MVAEAIEKYAGIVMLQSYTDRPRRTPDENGHTFLTKEQFDKFREEDMIAFTEWNGYRYCCLHSDIRPINTYVIDERSVQYLTENFNHKYNIYTIRFYRGKAARIKSVGKERVDRDEGKFNMELNQFDHVEMNNGSDKLFFINHVWIWMKYFLPHNYH